MINSAEELQSIVKARLKPFEQYKLSFGYPDWLTDTVTIVSYRRLLMTQGPLLLECRFFMQFATQLYNENCVFSKSASGAAFVPHQEFVPRVCYIRPNKDEVQEQCRVLTTPTKGQFVWGPWPDGTYMGWTQQGVLWETEDVWLSRCARVFKEHADDQDADPMVKMYRDTGQLDEWCIIEFTKMR